MLLFEQVICGLFEAIFHSVFAVPCHPFKGESMWILLDSVCILTEVDKKTWED